MSAPRGVELDDPYLVALEYVLREVVVGEFDHFRVGRVNGRRALGKDRQTDACKQRTARVNMGWGGGRDEQKGW